MSSIDNDRRDDRERDELRKLGAEWDAEVDEQLARGEEPGQVDVADRMADGENPPTIHDPTFPPPVWPSTPEEALTGDDEMPELDEGRTQ